MGGRLTTKLCITSVVVFLGLSSGLKAQQVEDLIIQFPFEDIILKVDTLYYSYSGDLIDIDGEPHLPFQYSRDEQVIEVRLKPINNNYFTGRKILLQSNPDYDLMDSITWINDAHFKFRLRFKSISKTDFLHMTFKIGEGNLEQTVRVNLFPYHRTRATIYPSDEDLYLAEEKRFEIITNNLSNLILDGEWKQQGNLEYRLLERDGLGYVSVIPERTGSQKLEINFDTRKPNLDAEGRPIYNLGKQTFNLQVKASRLEFLRLDKREIVKEADSREGIEIQLDNSRFLEMSKTYRLEDREERGGPLVAELYTVRRLSNDKVMCIIRPYLYHRTTDGYLYIKDGDEPRFITNVTIAPETKINKISILREGKEWTTDNSIRPGETIEVKLEGESLDLARFYFEDLDDISADTLTRSDNTANFKLKVPTDLNKRTLEIFNYSKKSGATLTVREFHRPRPLDFVRINYGDGPKVVNTLNQAILHDHTIGDIVLSFDYGKIDRGDLLYGKQQLEVEIRITGPNNELVEMQKIDFLEVCPDETSPRHAFYRGSTCTLQDIRLNNFLSRKTHSLDDWSRIEMTIRHKKENYGGEGYSQRVVIVLQKLVTFDIDVSFPAGLIIKKIGEDGFPPLGGISLAMLAQFTFYDRERIQKEKPYKIGAGFLAQNAFNFNTEADRDLGIVIIGSLYPIKRQRKLSFPLFLGMGYFLNDDKFFFLIGPGIRVNF